MADNFRHGCQGPDAEPAGRCFLDALKLLEPGNADNCADVKNSVAQTSEQVGSAGVSPGPVQGKVTDGFID